MARGGARTGAGRPAQVHTRHSPEAAARIRAKIQTDSIVQRLTRYINGEITMEASAVTAALGLLKKVLPDLSASENKTEFVHRYVARIPEKAKSADQWQQQHSPQTILQ